jgi:peptidoglycan/LPS O-acetylase OafA/YrhL
MYYFYSWLIEKQLFTLGETWPEALITCGVSIAAAWLCLKFYDLPVRRWLAKK